MGKILKFTSRGMQAWGRWMVKQHKTASDQFREDMGRTGERPWNNFLGGVPESVIKEQKDKKQ